jgi:outer membrane protein assembly complex protein YaeT
MGAKTISLKKIREELMTPQPSRWPWKKPPVFIPEDLDTDLERLRGLYRSSGFYQADITAHLTLDDRQVDIVFNIEEGPWVKVTQVELAVAPTEPPVDLSSLKEKWPLKVGDRFDEKTYNSLKLLYLDYLLDNGRPRAKVEGKVLLDEEKNTAQIYLTVRPGPLCFFGPATVKGSPETPEKVILRKLTFKEGEPFSYKKLYDSQQLIYGLDLFGSVSLTPQEVPETQNRIPVVIEVQEKKKRSLKVGVGYGDEDLLRARLGLRFRNVGGGGRMLDLDGRYSKLERRVQGTFFNPMVFSTNNDLVFQSGYIRQYLPGFTDKAYFTNVKLERDLPWHFRGYLGHSLEFARPFNVPLETLLLLTETQIGKLYRSSMVIAGLRQETVDNLVDPHRGGILALTGQVAPDFLGSNMQFVSTILDLRRFQALGKTDFIMAGRLKFGIIQPMQATSDIPIFRRLFAGGTNSVRGYRLDYLGPRNITGSPLGGQAVMEGSVEARIPIYKEFRGVAFLDFGNVFFKVRDIDLGQLKYSSGVGLRYQTFVGAIGIDIGFPLNPIDPHKDDYHVHFTIGQTF